MSSEAQDIYSKLEAGFLPYKKLAVTPVSDNGEKLIDARGFNGIHCAMELSVLPPSAGDRMMLRQSVVDNLIRAQNHLQEIKPDFYIGLTYAYRSPAIQKASFEKIKASMGLSDRNDHEALEQVHHFIAVPEVAGHPTGAAVDVLIFDGEDRPLDFGTAMHELEKNSYVFSPFISKEAQINRTLLRDVMMKADFAPYDGEWWHFSYGDREWAAYYNKPHAIYAPVDLDE